MVFFNIVDFEQWLEKLEKFCLQNCVGHKKCVHRVEFELCSNRMPQGVTNLIITSIL